MGGGRAIQTQAAGLRPNETVGRRMALVLVVDGGAMAVVGLCYNPATRMCTDTLLKGMLV